MENESSFKVEKTGHVAWLILNRPKQRNTMTLEFFQELPRLFKELTMTATCSRCHRRGELYRGWTLWRIAAGTDRPCAGRTP